MLYWYVAAVTMQLTAACYV